MGIYNQTGAGHCGICLEEKFLELSVLYYY